MWLWAVTSLLNFLLAPPTVGGHKGHRGRWAGGPSSTMNSSFQQKSWSREHIQDHPWNTAALVQRTCEEVSRKKKKMSSQNNSPF